MPLPAPLIYHLSPGASAEALLGRLEERLRLHAEPPSAERRTYFESFDGRLHGAGLALWAVEGRDGARVVLESPKRRLTAKLPRGAAPGFARDLPEGALRRAVEGPLSMRRLLPRAAVRREERELRLLDEREKTVARLFLTVREAGDPGASQEFQSLPAALRLVPVRGYGEAFERVRKVLDEEPDLALAARGEAAEAMAARGVDPGAYSSKLRLRLDPEMPAAEAARTIHRTLLATMEANEDGLRRDLDSEFLHDFRVAVRRTRSALGQVKGVFASEPLARFRREFSWLGKLTGSTRDLDVYLLKIPDYARSLPAEERRHLAPLEAFLRQRQRREHRKLVRELDSARYRELVASWRAFLEEPLEDSERANARVPIRALASKRLHKVSERMLAKGSAIRDETAAEALHALRIDCKKLRYLLEFFRSLYDEGEIAKLVKTLKRLQDNLGDFNDYEVQQEALRGFAREMAAAGSAPPETLLAMGRLVVVLEVGQAAERHRFARRFSKLAAPAGRERFHGLFTVASSR